MVNWFTYPFRRKAEKYSSDPDVLRSLRSATNRAVSSIDVNETTALNLSSVYAAVRVLSEDVSSLPFPVYRRLQEGGKEIDRSHPLHYLLNISPDDEITAMQYREYQMKCLNLWGNSYSEIEFTRSNELKLLHKIDPSTVTPERNKSGKIQYRIEGVTTPVPFEKMLHIAGLGDGLVGMSPIKQTKQTISMGLMLDRFGAAWFANGSRGGGIIKHPSQLSTQAATNLRESIEEIHGGPDNFGKWMVLEENANVEMLSVPPEDAQFLGTKTFNIQEVCRIFRIPCTLLQENSRSTFSNSEQEALNYEKFGIRPWLERIEAQINFKLLTRAERQTHFAEHIVEGLLRADIATRYNAYNIAKNGGWLNADEIRNKENMNPLPDGQGKIYLVPMNMDDAKKIADESPDTEETVEDNEDVEVIEEVEIEENSAPEYPRASIETAIIACRSSLIDSLERMHRREVQAIQRASKNPRSFLSSLDEFYDKHREIVTQAIAPSLEAYMACLGRSHDALTLSRDICKRNKKQLLDLSGQVTADELETAVSLMVQKWADQSKKIVDQLAT